MLRRKTQEVRKGGFFHIAPTSYGGLTPVLGSEKSHPSDRAGFGNGVPKRKGEVLWLRNWVGNGCRQQQSSPSRAAEPGGGGGL